MATESSNTSTTSNNNNDNIIYRVRTIRIGKDHPLYGYFDGISAAANNLHNAVLFRQRQLLTSYEKILKTLDLSMSCITYVPRFYSV